MVERAYVPCGLLDWTTSTLEAERQVEEKGMMMNRSFRPPRGCSLLLMAGRPAPASKINQSGQAPGTGGRELGLITRAGAGARRGGE